MNVTRATYAGAVALVLVTTAALALALGRDDGRGSVGGASPTSTAPVVQLGAPGQPNRTLSPGAAMPSTMAHTAADVAFMKAMVAHHEQALMMTALTRTNTSNADLALMAERMDVSQRDEIATMQRWLDQQAAAKPGPTTGPGGHGTHGGSSPSTPSPAAGASAAAPSPHTMPGMLTEAELASLKAESGAAFDRLFLQYMIRHHEGAISMVEELLTGGEGGQASDVFLLAQHMSSDQALEVARMKSMLADG